MLGVTGPSGPVMGMTGPSKIFPAYVTGIKTIPRAPTGERGPYSNADIGGSAGADQYQTFVEVMVYDDAAVTSRLLCFRDYELPKPLVVGQVLELICAIKVKQLGEPTRPGPVPPVPWPPVPPT